MPPLEHMRPLGRFLIFLRRGCQGIVCFFIDATMIFRPSDFIFLDLLADITPLGHMRGNLDRAGGWGNCGEDFFADEFRRGSRLIGRHMRFVSIIRNILILQRW